MSTGPSTILATEQHSNFRPPQLAVIVPSYNERDNIELLYEKVALALGSTPWEMIVVDDDSPDGTADLVNELSRV